MTISIPAAGLLATGQCTAACLLALDDDCDCRCAGRFHGLLIDAPVAVDPAWRRPRAVDLPGRTVLADVLDVVGDAERVHSDRLCTLLGQRWPDDYPAWTPVVLARALLAHGVRTRQVWGQTLDGGQTNRRGVHRSDVLAAVRKSRKAAG